LNGNWGKFWGIFFRVQKIRPSKIKEQSQIKIKIIVIIIILLLHHPNNQMHHLNPKKV